MKCTPQVDIPSVEFLTNRRTPRRKSTRASTRDFAATGKTQKVLQKIRENKMKTMAVFILRVGKSSEG